MKNIFMKSFFILTLLLLDNLFSYDLLWVEDPQLPWRDGQGTIEEAIISIRPRGMYMEYGLYLTFSARNLGFTNSDTLEVQFNFDLPDEAIVHDSWLWVGDDIIRGMIMDRWTASAIYDTIVNRRKDPSILFKRGTGRYELLVFPMAGDEERKVKITFLMPTQWSSSNVIASLPTNLLRTSKYDVQTFYVLTWLDQDWQNPAIIEFPNINFQFMSDTLFGDYYRADIPSSAIQSTLNFALDSPLNNGIYINKFDGGIENIYQLIFLPSQALNIQSATKVAVCFDYENLNSNISKSEILNTTKLQLHANLASTDSFNLIFSQLNIFRVSEDWISADSQNIEDVFVNLDPSVLVDYSNLPSLLANGVDFIKNNGNDASILLVSNSDQVGDYQPANQLINDLFNLMDPILPVHVVDFQTQNYPYYWIGGRSYRGNEYFYTNMARLSAANYYRMLYSGYTFSQLLSLGFQSLSGFISAFDLHTTLQNGFCYGRYYLNPLNYTTYLNRPILQIGKYNGTFPFSIEASGIYQSSAFSQQFIIPENEFSVTDSLSEEMWVGNFIQSLESQTQTNTVINEIINQSINERVLSIYSAFLCLDPERGGEVCYDCLDETQLVGIEDTLLEVVDDSLLQILANPNPFNMRTNIKINSKKSIKLKDMSFKIYNILGQVVRSFRPEQIPNQKYFEIVWDGTNDFNVPISTGTYFFVIQTAHQSYTLKLLLVK